MRWVNRHVRRSERLILGALPILLLVLLYLFLAAQRHAANPLDKVLPLPDGMAGAMAALLFQPDQLTGQLVFWTDTLASLQRLGMGLGISTLAALAVGLVARRAAASARDIRAPGHGHRRHPPHRPAAHPVRSPSASAKPRRSC